MHASGSRELNTRMPRMWGVVLIVACVLGGAWVTNAHAAVLSYVRDVISTSIPSTAVSHTIEFTLIDAVPASGHIVITPESGMFTIPAGLDYADIDLAVDTSGTYVDRPLAASANATYDGVAVVAGSDGALTITLNSSEGLPAGAAVRVTVGPAATFGGSGVDGIVNPSDVRSYRVGIETQQAGGTLIDYGNAMIAIVEPVTVSTEVEAIELLRFNGLPQGEISANNPSVEISLETNIPATCRYATTSGVLFEDMTGTFSPSYGSTFYRVLSGLQNGETYSYYVRCADLVGITNDTDYEITFWLKPTPDYDVSDVENGSGYPTVGSSGSGGFGTFANGSALLYLASVTLSGWSSPFSTVTVLKDGKSQAIIQAKGDGSFQTNVSGLERGTYTFLTYTEDAEKRRSAAFSSTLSLSQGSNNTISNIIVPPTIALEKEEVEIGEDVLVSAATVPSSIVELYVRKQSKPFSLGNAKKYTATSTASGAWDITIAGADMVKGTYEVKARTIKPGGMQVEGNFSTTVFLGVGEAPAPDLSTRADINKDTKVNLVDFSIMLSFWGTSHAEADINSDTNVNLADFSILLFNWTG